MSLTFHLNLFKDDEQEVLPIIGRLPLFIITLDSFTRYGKEQKSSIAQQKTGACASRNNNTTPDYMPLYSFVKTNHKNYTVSRKKHLFFHTKKTPSPELSHMTIPRQKKDNSF